VFSGLLQTQARLFSLIGLKRRPREVGTPSLSEYLGRRPFLSRRRGRTGQLAPRRFRPSLEPRRP
jgi:hypothetical protein